jgi:hypothetical protein
MKRHIATIRVDVEADSPEALQHVARRVVERIKERPIAVRLDGSSSAQVMKASVSRVRPARKR